MTTRFFVVISATMGSAATKKDSQTLSQQSVDVVDLMTKIRARLKEVALEQHSTEGAFRGSDAQFSGQGQSRRAGELVHSEELRFLNINHAYSAQHGADAIESHRGGFFGKIVVKVKRKFTQWLWQAILKNYLQTEKDFSSNLVRFLNDVGRYVDARDATNFWELIRKIDVDVAKVSERTERIVDAHGGNLVSTEKRLSGIIGDAQGELSKLREKFGELSSKVQELDRVTGGLEGMVSKLTTPPKATLPQAQEKQDAQVFSESVDYLLLENRFRGSEQAIRDHLKCYQDLFAGTKAPVLEIGSGRGELLSLLKEKGVEAYGVDMDRAMVRHATEKQVKAFHGDGIAHLRSLPDKSIGGVVAIQVVEHLTSAQLEELCKLASQKVVSGGYVVFETINPTSVVALSSNYFRDPTHVWPRHPDTLSFTMKMCGLDVEKVELRSPYAPDGELQQIPVESHMGEKLTQTVQLINRNLTQLNKLLYGYMDFSVVARVR
jgi:2-polyprenyl-3-methyl-5-hydroxy-6-metoxy-1,4-benzoquinol methylase